MGAMGARGAGVGLVALTALAVAGSGVGAPLATGPVLTLSGGDPEVAAVSDVAVTDAGDALVVLARRRSATEPVVLQVRQRRGARGVLAAPVAVSSSGSWSGVEAALGANGDAFVAYPAPSGLVVKVRRGWTGRWRDLSPPAAAGAEVSSIRLALTPGSRGRLLDVLWVEDGVPGPGTGGLVLRGARRTASTWLQAPDAPGGAPGAVALASGGAALAVSATPDGHVRAVSRGGIHDAWEGPVEVARVGVPTSVPLGVRVSATAAANGLLVAGWTGIPPGGTTRHAFVARRLPGAPTWDPPTDLGEGVRPPAASVSGGGSIAVAWPGAEGDSDVGPEPLLFRTVPPLSGPPSDTLETLTLLPAAGAAEPRFAADGSWVAGIFPGENAASSSGLIAFADRPGGRVRRTPILVGDSRGFAAGERSALLAVAAPARGTKPALVGVDDLGPLGLSSPGRVRAGTTVGVRFQLWRRTRVALSVLGTPARPAVVRTLPAGRSVIRVPLPARPGTYVIRATGREPGGRSGLRQQATVRVS